MEPASDIEAVPSTLRFPQMKPSKQGMNAEVIHFTFNRTNRIKTHMNTQHFWLSRKMWSTTDFKLPIDQ